jgi:phosphate/sulfate permease
MMIIRQKVAEEILEKVVAITKSASATLQQAEASLPIFSQPLRLPVSATQR